MKKTNKLLSVLLLGLMITGCDVEALPTDYDKTYGAINMEDVYDTVRNGQGEAALYNQLIEGIAEKEIKKAGRWDELCSRVQEKIDDMIEDQYTEVNYDHYTIDGDESTYLEVEDEKLLAYYRSQGYKIGNLSDKTITHDSNYWKASEVLKENSTYVNTYISKNLKSEVLTSMLNEQFIRDRKANSLYKTKQLRQIEYVYIDFDKEAEDESIDFIYNLNDDLIEGTTYDLEQVANDWKAKRKSVILENAKKAGDPELDEDGKYYSEFSSCGGSVNKCANEKMYAIDETEYYSEPKIYTNSDSPLLSSMTDVLFSSTLEYTDDEVMKVEADNGKTYYYLKSQSDVELGTNSLINVDTSTGNYYFVRFEIVENVNPNDIKDGETPYDNLTIKYEGQKPEYAIAQALATSASNYSNCILYYLDLYEVAIHDDSFFEYVFETYGYPEEDE